MSKNKTSCVFIWDPQRAKELKTKQKPKIQQPPLGALIPLAEDWGLDSRTSVEAYNIHNFNSQKPGEFWPLQAPSMYVIYLHKHSQNTRNCKNKINIIFKDNWKMAGVGRLVVLFGYHDLYLTEESNYNSIL